MSDVLDLMTVHIPVTHVWAVVIAWIACYVAGRWLIAMDR